MASSVGSTNRMWVGGLASGLDTQSIIDKLMTLERQPADALQQKRDTLKFQRNMLQNINLKLFELQNKATDLTFTRTFNTKSVSSTNERMVSAVAGTDAAVGSHTVVVKQMATATKAYSTGQLARNLEKGMYLQSLSPVGGSNLTLAQLGIASGDLQVDIAGGASQALSLTGISGTSTLGETVDAINSAIDGNATLKGKVRARYNYESNQVEFHLFDSAQTLTIKDGAGTVVTKLFGGPVESSKNTPIQRSTLPIRVGGSTLLSDLGLGAGVSMKLAYGGQPAVDLSLAGDMTIDDAVTALNHQIDLAPTLLKTGTPTGNPADRKIEFRFDKNANKLQLMNTDTGSSTSFVFSDNVGNFTTSFFGASSMAASQDSSKTLASLSMATKISSGTITVDGVQLSVNNSSDTLQDVLKRITNSTGVNATYDAAKDVIRLTRKDGNNQAIGLGSGADTSNFLSATFLLSSNQQSAAGVSSSASIGTVTASDAGTLMLQDPALLLSTAVTPGTGQLKVTVSGVVQTVNYDTATDTIDSVLDRIKKLSGVQDAFFDASTGKVTVKGLDKGPSATLSIADVTGNLAAALGMNGASASGTNMGPTLESSHHIADIRSTSSLASAGFVRSVSAGTYTINGVQFSITSTGSMSLQNVIAAINANDKAGVRAEYDTQNGRFILTSTNTGNTAVSVGAASDTSNILSVLGMDRATQEIGQNAVFNIQGMYGNSDIVRQSNDIKDVLAGTTITLHGVTSAVGETVTVSANTDASKKAIDDFLTAYNDMTDLIYGSLTEEKLKDSSGAPLAALTDTQKSSMTADQITEYETNYKKGLLNGDSTLQAIRTRMRTVMSSVVRSLDTTFQSLASIGITTGAIGSARADTELGRLTITDSDKLMTALKMNPDKVANLFGKDATVTKDMGIVRQLKNGLNEFTKSDGILTSRVGRSGTRASNSSMDRQIALINSQITRQQASLQTKEESLIKQYAQLESTISKYQSQSQAFQSQLAKLG